MSAQWASYSQLGVHRTCPQKWNYGYLQRLEKVDPEDAKVELWFGLWWHSLMAADSLVRGRALHSLCTVPKEVKTVDGGPTLPGELATPRDILALSMDWWVDLDADLQDVWIAKLGQGLPDRLAALYQAWLREWADEIATERPLAVEFGWRRPMPTNLPDMMVEPTDTMLVGYVDELYYDTKRRLIVARDHKTAKALSTQSTADDMMDSQLQLYAWGASPDVTSWGLGNITATAYDRVRSVRPKTPQVTQAGTLGKTITDYDLHAYTDWAYGKDGEGVWYPGRTKDGSQAGYYQAEQSVIEKLSTPAARSIWFQRTLTPLNANLIKCHLRASVDSAAEMDLTRKRAAATGEAPRNLTANCRWCDFSGLCRAQMVGGPEGDYDLTDFKLRVRR